MLLNKIFGVLSVVFLFFALYNLLSMVFLLKKYEVVKKQVFLLKQNKNSDIFVSEQLASKGFSEDLVESALFEYKELGGSVNNVVSVK